MKNKNYHELFKKAFGDDAITPDRLTEAIATFEKTIVSRKSRFDEFLAGKKDALDNRELRGLHLFRTKARCMNCHNGPLFSDNQFHSNGFFYPGELESDKGLYIFSHREEDIGRFKTPSLRDVTRTGPWMHNGSMHSLSDILVIYGQGAVVHNDRLIYNTGLNKREIRDLVAFLETISARPVEFTRPVLPE
jgi:cytochrome c peroxidase